MRVFIACKPYCATGGIELLHQLAAQLNERNIDVFIVYTNKVYSELDPTPEIYKKYGARIASEYLDAEDSIFIIPEVCTEQIQFCVKGTAVVWWLSVDNYLSGKKMINELRTNRNILHFVQSCYAKNFVKEAFGVEESYYLSDYISDTIREYADAHRDISERKNICFYNPKKGFEHIQKLIEKTENRFEWVSITGLEPIEVAKLLCSGKVYIDLGNHPGKDRIPREAAYCGCCILTNQKGSAAFQEDVDIPQKYKIGNDESYDSIVEKIDSVMKNYDVVIDEFRPYREKISKEKETFSLEIDEAVAIWKAHASHSDDKNLETETVIKYIDMMNYQLDNMKKINQFIKDVVSGNEYQKGIDLLLKEDYLYKEIQDEVWELMRYLSE